MKSFCNFGYTLPWCQLSCTFSSHKAQEAKAPLATEAEIRGVNFLRIEGGFLLRVDWMVFGTATIKYTLPETNIAPEN